MIPREIIDEIVYRNDIEQVIGSYVTLKRAGSNFNGLCPFHSEKTPSFTVFPATKSFYCFGCGAGGDVISFVMRSENLDYVDAVGFLAQRAGITIPEDDKGALAEKGVPRKRIYDILNPKIKPIVNGHFRGNENFLVIVCIFRFAKPILCFRDRGKAFSGSIAVSVYKSCDV